MANAWENDPIVSSSSPWEKDALVGEKKPAPEQTFGSRARAALGRGLEAVPESISGIGLGVKSSLGAKTLAGMQAEEIRAEAQKKAGEPQALSFEGLQKIYGEKGLTEALKNAPAYITEQILQSAPSMAIPLAAGAAAGAVSGPLAPIVGPLAGISTYGLQQYGNFMRRQAEEGATGETLAPGKAAAAAAITAPLGYFVDRFTVGLGKVPSRVVGKQVAAELAKRTGTGVAARAAKGATMGIVAEAPTEVLEQAAERWQAGLSLTGDDAKREYIEALAGAAAVGGSAGAASRVIAGRPKPEVKPEVPEVLEAKRAPEEPTKIEEEKIRPIAEATQVEAAQDIQAGKPAEPSPVVDTQVVNVDGKEATQTTRQDGSVEVDGVQIVPPTTETERETAQTTPTTKGEEDVARPNEPTSGTGVPVPLPTANELPAAQGIEGTQQRGVASAGPTTTEPTGGEGVQPAPIKTPLIKVNGKLRPSINNKNEPITSSTRGDKNFWKWFGDSKATDSEGKPFVFYHGTNQTEDGEAFTRFDTYGSNYGLMGMGSYFTDNPEVASKYTKKGRGSSPTVYPVYLSIKNPLDMDAKADPNEWIKRFPNAKQFHEGGDTNESWYRAAEQALAEEDIPYWEGAEVLQSSIISMGYDGITHIGGGRINKNSEIRHRVLIAFDPTQIKSATGNIGKFDSTNYDILQQKDVGGYNIDPQEQTIEKELAGKNFMQVAQWAVRSAPNAFAKVIAQKVLSRLQGMQARGVKFDFKVEAGNERSTKLRNARGITSFIFGKTGQDTTIKITLNGATVMDNQAGFPSGMNYVTVLHELLHAATRGQLKFMKSSDPLVKELIDLRNKVIQHFNDTDPKDMTPFMKRYYNRENNSLDDIDEMVSWGMTDEDMQKFLGEIKVGEKTGFSKLVETIRKILGLGQPYESALDRLVKTTESILDESIDVIGDGIESQGYSYGTKAGKKPLGQQQSLFSKKVQEIFGEEFQLGAKDIKEKAQQALQKQKPITSMEGLDDEFVKKLNKIFRPETKTFIDKAESFKQDMWKKLAQGVADQYRTIKDYSDQAYMMARMSKSVDGALEGILFHGQVFNDGGALNIKQNTKGLIDIMKPLGTDVDRYQMWVALNRDARLPKEKRSFDPELVAQRSKLAEGTLNGKPRLAVYEAVQKDMNALNRSVLDVAYDAGLINSEAYEVFSNDIFYIPFYQQMEDGDIQGASTASGLVGQKFSKQLKGGEKQLGDLMENTLRNWSHILSASMKNQAANETIKAAEELDAAFEVKEGGKNTVKVMRNGDPIYFEVTDPMLLESIMSIAYMGPKSKFLDVAKNFKNMLQFGVTISPAFKVRNLLRDSISAMAVTDLKKNPFANVIEGWIASDKNNPAHISALAGGAIFNFGSTVEGDQAALTKRLIEKGVRKEDILDTPEKVKEGLKYIWDKYQEFGNKSEAANRMALYNQLVKDGKTHLEASFYARDMLDFSMQGSFGSIRMVAQVVPFFNARVQGLYKLGRDGIMPTSRVIYNTITGKEIERSDKKKATSFSVVTGAIALASMALYLGFKDDEEYQKREAWDRDNFWWFKLPGMEYAVRIPKPFEVGAFGTIAERTLEQIIDQGAEGKQFGDSLSRMLWDTFSMNPVPQMFKPLVDLYSNKDSFTGAPIESAGMERLSKQERVTDSTSPIAKVLGGLTSIAGEGLSPVQIDYAIKAYFGWLGGTVASASTYAVAPFKEGAYPDMKWADTVSMGFIKSLPANQSRYVTAFYENNQQINQAFADMKHYAELGESEKVQEILEKKGDMIALQKMYDKTAKNMANARKQIRVITDDKEMSGADKREEIDRLKQLISMMAEQAEAARKSMKS
jgi:hypothetical protein